MEEWEKEPLLPTQVQCCGEWVDYPTAGHDTECPNCHTRFTLKDERPEDA